MRIFGTGARDKVTRQKKHSLIRILYIYPIIFFLVGLTTIIAYYTWLQIYKYKKQVEELKTEFPEKQRTELKSRILLIKDYIYWVKSHPEDHIIQHLNSRVNTAETILNTFSVIKNLDGYTVPEALADTLNEFNKRSENKIIILNKEQVVLYPAYPFRQSKGKSTPVKLNSLYKFDDINSAYLIIKKSLQNKQTTSSYLLLKSTGNDEIKIGITFQADQLNTILQEVVLDSLSKVKYTNNEYIIINTYNGFALLSRGQIQIPPIDIKNSAETNWKEIFNKELDYAKKREGGYLTYFWRNQPDVERSEKTSYFSGINDWEWIIGTGFFTSDINPIIAELNAELWNDIINNLIRFFIFLLILNVLAYLTMRFYAIKAKSNILLFLHFFKRAAQGIQIIDSSKLAFSEFDAIAKAANQMIYERERIKSVLSAEKSRLRYMIDAIPDLIFFKDVDSKFQGCNKAFEKYINN